MTNSIKCAIIVYITYINPGEFLDEGQMAHLDAEYRRQHYIVLQTEPFYHTGLELDPSHPDYESNAYWNRMQNAKKLGLEITKENVQTQPIYPVVIPKK